jgi:hypothetical protein
MSWTDGVALVWCQGARAGGHVARGRGPSGHTTARPKQTSPQGDGACTARREVGDLGPNEKLAIG